MANYNYHCFDCEKTAHAKYADKLTECTADDGETVSRLPKELYEELILFETSHAMRPTDAELREAMECPRCQGHNCEKTLYGSSVYGYTKGYGWLDRKGITRDMNRCKLATDDPYAPYRVGGEVDYIDNNLKKEGQRNTHKVTSVPHKEMEKAVTKVVSSPANKSPAQ